MLDRSVPPAISPPVFQNIPDPVIFSDPGKRIFLFPATQQPVFRLEIIFSSGSADLANPAIAALHGEMLREGCKKYSAADINNHLDRLGAFFTLRSGLDHTFLTLYARSEFFQELVDLLKDMLFEPTFPEVAIEKQKNKLIQDLKINQEKTSYWAPRLLRKGLFGAQHSYANLLSSDYFKNVSRQDLVVYHQSFLKSIQHILLAGDINKNKLPELEVLYNNNQRQEDKSIPQLNRKRAGKKIIEKTLANTSQASIALGIDLPGMKARHYPQAALLIKILGGYFGSRLMKKLREEEGLTYGIHAFPVHLKGGSYLQIQADVEKSSVDKSITICLAEIDKVTQYGMEQHELEIVRNYMLGEFVNESNTVFDFADLYKSILIQQLPVNYYESFYRTIQILKPEDIQDISQELFITDDFVKVKVY